MNSQKKSAKAGNRPRPSDAEAGFLNKRGRSAKAFRLFWLSGLRPALSRKNRLSRARKHMPPFARHGQIRISILVAIFDFPNSAQRRAVSEYLSARVSAAKARAHSWPPAIFPACRRFEVLCEIPRQAAPSGLRQSEARGKIGGGCPLKKSRAIFPRYPWRAESQKRRICRAHQKSAPTNYR